MCIQTHTFCNSFEGKLQTWQFSSVYFSMCLLDKDILLHRYDTIDLCKKIPTTLQYHLISSAYPEMSLIDSFFFPRGSNHSLHLVLICFVLLNLGGPLFPLPLPLTLHAPFLMTKTFGRSEADVYRMSHFLDFHFDNLQWVKVPRCFSHSEERQMWEALCGAPHTHCLASFSALWSLYCPCFPDEAPEA